MDHTLSDFVLHALAYGFTDWDDAGKLPFDAEAYCDKPLLPHPIRESPVLQILRSPVLRAQSQHMDATTDT